MEGNVYNKRYTENSVGNQPFYWSCS
jgi:hypothetical protein